MSDGDPAALDGLAIKAVRRRFLALNRDRLSRVRDTLRPRQRPFLDVLPLLFHINHPLLPGYLSPTCPAGVAGYQAGPRALEAARGLARSLRHERRARRRHDLDALYIMGSTGTIGQSAASDFDVWLCVRPDLDAGGREQLRTKAEAIASWAATLGLEVHCFVLDDQGFRRREHAGPAAEGSGSTQHHLLLDEFYRSALLLAGRYPVWWLVPPEHEADYAATVETLLQQRFVEPGDCLDFGGLGEVTAAEFAGGALWQLYKGVSSPYKSVLKILLMRAYAADFPAPRLLGLRFKARVHGGQIHADQLDPYLLLWERVAEHLLQTGETQTLQLARRCLYFKVGLQLSREPGSEPVWQREAIDRLVRQWGWGRAELIQLDGRQHWKVEKVREERRILVETLMGSYRQLRRFAEGPAAGGQTRQLDPADLTLLGRRLFAAFERKAGKIELINPGISEDLGEDALGLVEHSGEGGSLWWLVRNRPDGEPQPLWRSEHLLELLTWAHCNGLIHPQRTRLSLAPGASSDLGEVSGLLEALAQELPVSALQGGELGELAGDPQIRAAAIFVNTGHDPLQRYRREGVHLVSGRSDALSYGSRRENLARRLSLVVLSSWQEILLSHHDGDHALADCLCDYLAWSPQGRTTPPAVPPVYSFSSARGGIIARRVEQVFAGLIQSQYLTDDAEHARYLLAVGSGWYLFQGEYRIPRYRHLADRNALLAALAEPQPAYSPLHADPQALDDPALAAIFAANQPGVIQVYLHPLGEQAQIWILDERGSLFGALHPWRDQQTLLAGYARFLGHVRERLGASQGAPALSFHRLQPTAAGGVQWQRENPPVGDGPALQAIAEPRGDGALSWTLHFDGQCHDQASLGDQAFTAAAAAVRARRQGGQDYPIHLSDLDLPAAWLRRHAPGGVQTLHYLVQKQHIERRLLASAQGPGR